MRYLLLLLSWLPLAAGAQTTIPAWSGGTTLVQSNDSPLVATDQAGNLYIAGWFAAPLSLDANTTLTLQINNGNYDGYVAKYSPTGTLLWARQLSGIGQEYIIDLVLDDNGNPTLLFQAGNGSQLGSLTYTCSAGYSLGIARLDAQGQPLALTEVATGMVGQTLARDPSGNLYLSAYLQHTGKVGGVSLSVTGSVSAFDQVVAKLSATGVVQWVQQGCHVYNSPQTYDLMGRVSLVAAADGVYFLWSCSYMNTPFANATLPPKPGDADGVVFKFSPQGTIQWTQWVGGNQADYITGGHLDGLGRLVVTGLTRGAGYYSGPFSGVSSASTGFVTVLEPAAGTTVWSSQLARTATSSFNDVASDASGNLYLAGSFAGQSSLGGTTLTAAGSSDGLVASFTPTGALRWTQQMTGSGTKRLDAIALGSGGQLHVGGNVSGTAQLGSTTLISPTNSSAAFVAHLGGVLASRPGTTAAPLACYPNPAASSGTLALPPLPAGTELALLDATGRTVRRQPAAPTLPLAGLAPGLYQVQATAPDGAQWHSRLVVE